MRSRGGGVARHRLMKRHQTEQGALIADALGHNVRDEIRRGRETDRKGGKAAS